jgi:serine/threonine-protein kinase
VLVWLPEEMSRHPELIAEISHATRRAEKLEHPHIIRVFDFVDNPEGKARAVEYVDGESLRRILDVAVKVPYRLAARIAADACLGVQHAHSAPQGAQPFFHGDIRPETVLISFSGIVKVSGYGALSVAPREPGGRRVRGRRDHCAPEQLLGGREPKTPETDVYLLGLFLYECITGKVPFAEELDFDQAVLTRPAPEAPPELCPPALSSVITQAMAKKTSERYATPELLRQAIEQAVNPLPSHDELAQYLQTRFPEGDSVRVARKQMLQDSISKLAASTKGPVQLIPPPLRRSPGRSEAAPSPPEPRAPRRRSFWPVALFVAMVSLAYVGSRPMPKQLAWLFSWAKRPTSEAAPADPPGRAVPRPEPRAASPSPPDPIVPGPGDHHLSWQTLSLDVEPAVEVLVDDAQVGRTPVVVKLPPGRHILRLTDSTLGINATRTVVMGHGGTQSQRVHLGHGLVAIRAPHGAEIFIDGKLYGAAPQEQIPVYEGNHKLLVTHAGNRWHETFDIRPNERLSFDINFQ